MSTRLPACEMVAPVPPYRNSWQQHSWHELIVPIEGQYDVAIDNEMPLSSSVGTCIFIPATVRHKPQLLIGQHMRFYCCMWNSTAMDQTLTQASQLNDSGGRMLILCRWLTQATQAANTDVQEFERIDHMLQVLDDTIICAHETHDQLADPAIRFISTHVRDNLAEQNRIDDLAQRTGLSTAQFIERFRNATGTTPGQYIMQLRLDRALSLLKTTEMTTAAIAAAVGYASASHLCQVIRRRTGRAASSFRQSN